MLRIDEKGLEVGFTFNGVSLRGLVGEPIAAALLANGIRVLGHREKTGSPRGIFCGIGQCFECRVVVNGVPGIRACITPLAEGMVVETQQITGVKAVED